MIRFLIAAENPCKVQDLRMAYKWPMVLLLYLIYAVAFFALIALFMGYLAVVYGQRMFNFAVDCVLGVLE